MSDASLAPKSGARPPLVERISGVVAVLGGFLLLAMSTLVVTSVIGRWLSGTWLHASLPWLGPINGDFELVSMGAAIAVFASLPYCQARRGNIMVDTFTGWLPARVNAYIDAFWEVVYAAMMGLLTACLVVGTMEHYSSGQTTMLLQLIAWPAIAISTALLALLAVVALATAVQRVRGKP